MRRHRPRNALQWYRACYFLSGHNPHLGAHFSLGGHNKQWLDLRGTSPKWPPVAQGLLLRLHATDFEVVSSRGGVEDTRLEAKAKNIKKIRGQAKDSLSEDRTSRGQGQECSRPRPRIKGTGASVLQKKGLQNFFQAIFNSSAYPEF